MYNIDKLTKAGAKVKCYDPEAMENVKKSIGDKVTFCHDAYEATDGADALLIATEWPVFRTPDFDRIKAGLTNPVIFDGRNLYSLDDIDRLGYTYFSIGRATING